MKANIITLTTDFGLKDPYQGAMKGSILSVNPSASVIDITHLVPPGNIIEGSLVLKDAFSYFPEGTVHVGVVDPGVGGQRRPVLIETERYIFVGPDNGLFSGAVEKEKVLRIIHLTNMAFFRKDRSPTFHGRDIFAPVAAHLSLGADPGEFGEQIERIEELYATPALRVEGLITGSVIFVDSFGNLITNISGDDIRSLDDRAIEVTVRGQHIKGVDKTYGDVRKGLLVALIGSSGRLEIAVNSGSASETIGASVGERVTVRVKEG